LQLDYFLSEDPGSRILSILFPQRPGIRQGRYRQDAASNLLDALAVRISATTGSRHRDFISKWPGIGVAKVKYQ
jgi:hypothetical protein